MVRNKRFELTVELGDTSDEEASPPQARKREMSKSQQIQMVLILLARCKCQGLLNLHIGRVQCVCIQGESEFANAVGHPEQWLSAICHIDWPNMVMKLHHFLCQTAASTSSNIKKNLPSHNCHPPSKSASLGNVGPPGPVYPRGDDPVPTR